MTLTPGTRLGPYEIVAAIGAGGMGQVYRATDTRLKRQVAIKVLAPDLLASEPARERFEREARTIAALNHPNICTVYDVGRMDGQLYLVLEHLEGETLAARVADLGLRPLRLPDAVLIGAQVADALDAAHAQGVVHRDVKPSNVMLTKSGAKLMDFGVAHVRDLDGEGAVGEPRPTASEPLTGPGQIVGTVHYMAPEQLDGRTVDARADIFALGALLYELLTGRPAFEADSQAGLISAILRDDPASLSSAANSRAAAALAGEDAPTRRSARRLEGIVARCLAKRPEERWQSAKDVAYQLRWAADEHQRSEETPAHEGMPRRGLSRGVVVGAVVGAVAISAAVLALFAGRSQDSVPTDAPPLLRTRLELGGMMRGSPKFALSHNGRWLAVLGFDRATVLDLSSGATSAVPGWGGGVRVAWSADDRRLVISGAAIARVIEIADGRVEHTREIPIPAVDCVSVSADLMVAGSTRGPLMRTSLQGGVEWTPASALDTTLGELGHSCPQALPDGRSLIYTAVHADRAENRVYLAVVGEGTRTQILQGDITDVRVVAPHWVMYVTGTDLVARRLNLVSRELIGNPVVLEKNLGSDGGVASFSASDTGLLVTSTGNETRLEWFDRGGTSLKSEVAGRFVQPTLSPDGTKVVMHATGSDGNTDVWAYDLVRSLLSRVTTDKRAELYPMFAPSGAAVLFSRGLGAGLGSQVVTSKLDGSEERVIIEPATALMFVDDVVRQDGTLILERWGTPGAPDLVSVPWTGGRSVRTVLETPFRELNAAVSADGRWLAYESDRSGRREIYIQPFGRAGDRIQVSTAGGSTVRWRRDGREVYFVAPDSTLVAVGVSVSGDALLVSKEVPLFKVAMPSDGGPQYDVAADGRRILVNVLQTSALDLVVNWPTLMGETTGAASRSHQ